MSADPGGDASILAAIQDLTRVTIALSGRFDSKADAVRQLANLGVTPSRIAALLGVPGKSVHAELSKAKKRRPHKRGKE